MRHMLQIVVVLFMTMQLQAQQKKITGTVTAQSDGIPLPGVNIMVKGTWQGVQTNFDGEYSIVAIKGNVLTFTYVGFQTKEVKIGDETIIDIALEEDAAMLEEVVVIGYSIQTRGYTSNSVYKASASEIKRQKQKAYHQSIAQQLKGKVKGVLIKSDNFTSNYKQPLYIVDGVPIPIQYNQVVEHLRSEDIEHVNTYKSGQAQVEFGVSARYGCIVISTKKGNYRIENDESYAQINENKFERVSLSPLSTFSIDVDKASYSNIRRMMNNGEQIPVDAVKIEEMVNYFDYNYPQPKDEHPFSINTEVSKTPWNADTKIVRIGLQGKTYENEELPASNLTFLIDVSGSMSDANKLPLLKSSFKLLVNQLREKDKVSIVVYAGAAGLVLPPTSGAHKEQIINALDNLNAGGSTAGGVGIELAYKIAQDNFVKNGNNRVILATDGDFNVGKSSNRDMENLIEEKRKSGVYLSVLGFGYGNYKDSKLEILADKGNGNHAYIDTMQEAQKIFGKEFGGTLHTIAKDVKIQVEFNPKKVQAYRLLGYENRLLADEDFIDDTKDAGELGSGHTVTALYEVIPVGIKSEYLKDVDDLKYTTTTISNDYSNELFTVKFRYKKPDGTKSIEMVHVQKDEISEPSTDFRFASAVALFGMQLKHSQYDNHSTVKDVITLAIEGKGEDKDGYRSEFVRLLDTYQNL